MSEKEIILKIAAKYLGQEQMKKLQEDLKGAEKQTKTWWEVTKGFLAAEIFKKLATSVVEFAKFCVNSYLESERAVNRLNVALKNNGTYTKSLSAEYQRYAKQLQAVTAFSDEQVMETEALLSTFGLAGKSMKEATQAALDLSVAQGIDLNAATMLLGKAYQGNTDTLGRYGIQIQKTGNATEDFAKVIKVVNDRVGKSAQAELDTFAGRWKQMKNIFGEIAEKVGQKMVPYLEEAVRFIKYAAEYFGVIVDLPKDLQHATDAEIKELLKLRKEFGRNTKEYEDYRKIVVRNSKEREQIAEKEDQQAQNKRLAIEDEIRLEEWKAGKKRILDGEVLTRGQALIQNTELYMKTAEKAGQAYTDAFTAATQAGDDFATSLQKGMEGALKSVLRMFKDFLIDKLTAWYEESMAEAAIEAVSDKGASAWKLGAITAEFGAGLVAINAAIPFARGATDFVATKPTTMLVGEEGTERVTVKRRGDPGFGAGGGGNTYIFQGPVMGNKIQAEQFVGMIEAISRKRAARQMT